MDPETAGGSTVSDDQKNDESGEAQVIVLPRCRKRDGGCGSHRVHCQGTVKLDKVGIRKLRYYSCLQCGRRFKVLVIED